MYKWCLCVVRGLNFVLLWWSCSGAFCCFFVYLLWVFGGYRFLILFVFGVWYWFIFCLFVCCSLGFEYGIYCLIFVVGETFKTNILISIYKMALSNLLDDHYSKTENKYNDTVLAIDVYIDEPSSETAKVAIKAAKALQFSLGHLISALTEDAADNGFFEG